MPSERSNPRTASDQGTESAYDSLLRRYGKAMLRIEELQAQLEAASTNDGPRGENAKSPQPGQERSPEVDQLLAKVEALEKRLGVSPENEAEAADTSREADSSSVSADEPTGETAQLRLQLNNLANQLAQTEALLQEAQGKTRSRRRRSRGTRARSKWKFWHRWSRRY